MDSKEVQADKSFDDSLDDEFDTDEDELFDGLASTDES